MGFPRARVPAWGEVEKVLFLYLTSHQSLIKIEYFYGTVLGTRFCTDCSFWSFLVILTTLTNPLTDTQKYKLGFVVIGLGMDFTDTQNCDHETWNRLFTILCRLEARCIRRRL